MDLSSILNTQDMMQVREHSFGTLSASEDGDDMQRSPVGSPDTVMSVVSSPGTSGRHFLPPPNSLRTRQARSPMIHRVRSLTFEIERSSSTFPTSPMSHA